MQFENNGFSKDIGIQYTFERPNKYSALIRVRYKIRTKDNSVTSNHFWTYKRLDAFKLINHWNITTDLKYTIIYITY